MRASAALFTAILLAGCGEDAPNARNPASGGSASSGGAAGTSGSAGSATGGSASGGGGSAGTAGGAGTAGSSASAGSAGASNSEVDATTLGGKVVMGYQGWFACPGDGAPPDRWVHWFNAQTPSAENLTVDMWPDVSELDASELFDTDLTLPGGATAQLYSAWTTPTVVRHFSWMKDHGLDGVMLQRFLSELGDPAFRELRDKVLSNVRAGAEAHGRVFAVMYDVSGASADMLLEDLSEDWAYLVGTLGVTQSPRYLHHDGKPLLAIWGLGFSDRPASAAQAQAIVDHFKSGAPAAEQVTLLGGVPTGWLTLSGDSKPEAEWADVYRSFDVVSPWAVGRYADDPGADTFNNEQITPGLAAAQAAGIEYLPVVFPGFSWTNLNDGVLNQIPRRRGDFLWRQIYNAVSAGSNMLYVAMFDEVDEATAIFKTAPTAAEQPAQASFVSLDIDGQPLPSDWYLRVTGAATEVLHGTRTLSEALPLTPP